MCDWNAAAAADVIKSWEARSDQWRCGAIRSSHCRHTDTRTHRWRFYSSARYGYDSKIRTYTVQHCRKRKTQLSRTGRLIFFFITSTFRLNRTRRCYWFIGLSKVYACFVVKRCTFIIHGYVSVWITFYDQTIVLKSVQDRPSEILNLNLNVHCKPILRVFRLFLPIDASKLYPS